jgi:hypothetical protein
MRGKEALTVAKIAEAVGGSKDVVKKLTLQNAYGRDCAADGERVVCPGFARCTTELGSSKRQ